MYAQSMYRAHTVYISRLRGLCTFILTLLLCWNCFIFPVYLFLYSYNYAHQQIRFSWVCVWVWECVPRQKESKWTRAICTKSFYQRKCACMCLLSSRCWWIACEHTIPIAAAIDSSQCLAHINTEYTHTFRSFEIFQQQQHQILPLGITAPLRNMTFHRNDTNRRGGKGEIFLWSECGIMGIICCSLIKFVGVRKWFSFAEHFPSTF